MAANGKLIERFPKLIELQPYQFRAQAIRAGLGKMSRAWTNGIIAVQEYPWETEWGLVHQILLRRADGKKPSFYDAMAVKNQLYGPERTAIEIYPPMSKLVDQDVPLYWYWILPEGFSLPFGNRIGQDK